MARKKKDNKKYIYVPMDPSELCVGKVYYSNCEGRSSRWTAQSVRSRIAIDHKNGIHNEETVEEYMEYRGDLERWCKKGWLHNRIAAPVEEDFTAGLKIERTTQSILLKDDFEAVASILNEMSNPQKILF